MHKEQTEKDEPPFLKIEKTAGGDSNKITREFLDSLLIEYRHIGAEKASLEFELFGEKFKTPIMFGGMAAVVAGSPVIESVFSIPGVGAYLLSGVNQHDYPVVWACVIFLALFTSIAMLIMDLCYAFLDPRIKAQYSKGKKVK